MPEAKMDQQSEEWFSFRMGKPSASRMSDIMAKTRSGPAASRKNYLMELLCQRLTGQREECYTNAAMMRGTELEPVARSAYEVRTGIVVDETGCWSHPKIERLIASPDGLADGNGLIEIKCPNTAQHVEFLRTGVPAGPYQWQMLTQMACTEREWVDFVSYDDRMPELLQVHCVRFMRDDKRISELEAETLAFLEELDALEKEMLIRMEQLKAA